MTMIITEADTIGTAMVTDMIGIVTMVIVTIGTIEMIGTADGESWVRILGNLKESLRFANRRLSFFVDARV